MLPLNPRPKPRQEPAKEEALGGQEPAGQPGLEEADACPDGGDGAGEEGGGAESAGEEVVEGGQGGVVQAAEARKQQGGVEEEREAG